MNHINMVIHKPDSHELEQTWLAKPD